MKHCSNCGEKIDPVQQFCRACGAELLIETQRRRMEPRTLIFTGLFGALAGGLVVLIGGFLGSNRIAFIGCVFAVLAFAAMLVGAILGDGRRRARKTAVESAVPQYERPALDKAETTNQLPPIPADAHFPTSVTEHTTTKLRVD